MAETAYDRIFKAKQKKAEKFGRKKFNYIDKEYALKNQPKDVRDDELWKRAVNFMFDIPKIQVELKDIVKHYKSLLKTKLYIYGKHMKKKLKEGRYDLKDEFGKGDTIQGLGKIDDVHQQKGFKQYEIGGQFYHEDIVKNTYMDNMVNKMSFNKMREIVADIHGGRKELIPLAKRIYIFLQTSKNRDKMRKGVDNKVVSKFNWFEANLLNAISENMELPERLPTFEEFVNEVDAVPGGKGQGRNPEDFDPFELELGIRVELEHFCRDNEISDEDKDDPELLAKSQDISIDHLSEEGNEDYYTRGFKNGTFDEDISDILDKWKDDPRAQELMNL